MQKGIPRKGCPQGIQKMKTCFASTVILELQITVTMKYLYIVCNITKMLKVDNSLEHTTYCSCSRNLNRGILLNLAVSPLPQYPTDMCKHIYQDIHNNVQGCIIYTIQNSK